MEGHAINHLCSCRGDVLLESSSDAYENERKRIHPRIRNWLRLESSFQLSVESLDHAISLRVISSGPGTFRTDEQHEIVPTV